MEPFKVPIIKADYAKKAFRGYFLTNHNGVTDCKYLTRLVNSGNLTIC